MLENEIINMMNEDELRNYSVHLQAVIEAQADLIKADSEAREKERALDIANDYCRIKKELFTKVAGKTLNIERGLREKYIGNTACDDYEEA